MAGDRLGSFLHLRPTAQQLTVKHMHAQPDNLRAAAE